MKILVFGDSFSRIFSLVKPEIVTVYPYKGATLKGLTKKNNPNRIKIEKVINNEHTAKYAIFVFGQVDLNLSFYYDLVKNNTETKYNQYIIDYTYWIYSICHQKKIKPIILGVYPSPLDEYYTLCSLVKYGSLDQETVDENEDVLIQYAEELTRQMRYFEFNFTLKDNCNKNGIIYFDLTHYLYNTNLTLKKEYRDISEYNMHLRWEPIIPILITELGKLHVPIEQTDIVKDIHEIEEKYIKYKNDKMEEIKGYS